MENTVRLSDEELIEIAMKAVKACFAENVIETSEIEIRHSVKAVADMVDADDETTPSIWLIHQTVKEMFNPKDIAHANQRVWMMMRERGDQRLLSLYHGYRSDPTATKKAA
jgi:hypothetical protein